SINMDFMIHDTCSFINYIHDLFTFQPDGFSDNSFLISSNFSSDTSRGLPLAKANGCWRKAYWTGFTQAMELLISLLFIAQSLASVHF
ncbi:MAG: hypothetical protein WAM14_09570, partial [Candidatus Nitrosopolaris sp.]